MKEHRTKRTRYGVGWQPAKLNSDEDDYLSLFDTEDVLNPVVYTSPSFSPFSSGHSSINFVVVVVTVAFTVVI